MGSVIVIGFATFLLYAAFGLLRCLYPWAIQRNDKPLNLDHTELHDAAHEAGKRARVTGAAGLFAPNFAALTELAARVRKGGVFTFAIRLARKRLVPCYGSLIFLLVSPAGAEEGQHGIWTQYKGKGYVLCDALLKELNRHKYPENPGACPWAVVAGYPKFKELPWQELDAAKYEELLYQLQRLNALGEKDYFSGVENKSKKGYASRTESYSREQVRAFLQKGGQIRLWRTPLPKTFGGLAGNPETAGPLNILQLRSKITLNRTKDLGLDQCPDIPVPEWSSRIMLVNDGLMGPDPRLNPSVYQEGLNFINNTSIWMYGGIPHRFSIHETSIEIYRDDLPLQEFCRLIYSRPLQ